MARLHSNPAVGKNHLDSFLVLPMQRLTRLKLLVEVIRKLQILVKEDEANEEETATTASTTGSTETMTPVGTEASKQLLKLRRMKITPNQQENAALALRELKRVRILMWLRQRYRKFGSRWHTFPLDLDPPAR